MKITTKKEFFTLLKGATFLASGGGGPFSLAKTIVNDYFKDIEKFEINLIDANLLKNQEWTAIAAGMAQPSAGAQLTPQAIVEPTVNAVKAMQVLITEIMTKKSDERFKGFKKFDLLTPIEVGAINVTIPLITAYLLGENLSIVDGDPSGRSVPTIDLTTFATTQPVMPNMATSAGDKYEFTVLSLKNYKDLGTAYSTLIQAGLIGIDTGLCMAPMTAEILNDGNIVKGTLSDAFKIGKIFEEETDSLEKIQKIQKYLLREAQTPRKMRTICSGIVKEYFTQTEADTDLGYLTLETDDKRIFTILIQNENIIGQFDDETGVTVTGPDSICYISSENGSFDDSNIYDNSLIAQKLQENEEVRIHVVAIEAANVIKENKKLMYAWSQAYKISRYYGAYNNTLWK